MLPAWGDYCMGAPRGVERAGDAASTRVMHAHAVETGLGTVGEEAEEDVKERVKVRATALPAGPPGACAAFVFANTCFVNMPLPGSGRALRTR